MKTPTGTELRPYQVEGARSIRNFDGICLLADDPGLGKTIQSFYYAWKFLPDAPSGPIVVVCPSHAKLVWRDELWKHFGVRVEVLEGLVVPEGKKPPWNLNSVLVINYEILTTPHWEIKKQVPANSWLAYLLALKPRLLIADEGQCLSNPMSARSRGVRKIARITPRRIVTTGTPMANRVISIWSLLNILRPDLYPSFFDFANEYTVAEKLRGEWVYKGARNLPALHTRLKQDAMIRRRKEDVLDQLPRMQRSVIQMDVDLQQYRTAEFNFLQWLENEYMAESAATRKAKQLSRYGYLSRLAGKLKINAVKAWVRDFLDTDRKLLLGVCHYAVSGALMEEFGDRAILVDGTLTDKQKHAAFEKFNYDPACVLLVGNILSAGSAWSCTSTSDSAICEIPYRPSDLLQFEGRTIGINRGVEGRGAHTRYLVTAGTVEIDKIEMIQRKHNWATVAIDGGLESDFNLDELIERMKQRHGINRTK